MCVVCVHVCVCVYACILYVCVCVCVCVCVWCSYSKISNLGFDQSSELFSGESYESN